MALGALWLWEKYSCGVWERFARQASTILKKLFVCVCSGVGVLPRKGRPVDATKWMLRMEMADLEPDVQSCSSIVNSYAKAGFPDESAKWLQRMEDTRIMPNLITYRVC